MRSFQIIFCAALLLAGLLAKPAACGPVADDLSTYTLGGSALGCLVGTAAATVPFLNDKQGFDFLVGAGGGAVAGAGLGLLLGVLDVFLHPPQPGAAPAPMAPAAWNLPALAWDGHAARVAWTAKF